MKRLFITVTSCRQPVIQKRSSHNEDNGAVFPKNKAGTFDVKGVERDHVPLGIDRIGILCSLPVKGQVKRNENNKKRLCYAVL